MTTITGNYNKKKHIKDTECVQREKPIQKNQINVRRGKLIFSLVTCHLSSIDFIYFPALPMLVMTVFLLKPLEVSLWVAGWHRQFSDSR